MAVPNWVIGVVLATLASFISNLGLNLQKLNHTINEQRIRARIREARRENKQGPGGGAATTTTTTAATTGGSQTNHGDLLPAAAAYGHGAPLSSDTQYGDAGTRVLHDSRDAAADAAAAAAAGASAGAGGEVGGSYQNEDAHLLISEPGASQAPATPSSVEGAAAAAVAASGSGSTRLAAAAALQHVDYSAQGMWRLGLGLVVAGSLLDFCALMFAAQSIVAPLGSLTLVSNTLLAPLLLGESVSRRDLLATAAIVAGSAMAVVFADHADAEFSVEDIFGLFMTPRFACYAALVSAALAGLLAAKRRLAILQFAQPRRYAIEGLARYHRFTYAALAGTVGAQSVLFAKCTGEILANSLRGRALFLALYWQTWAIGAGMFATIYFQIKWLNAGLQRFDALYIVPVFQSFWILVSVAAGMVFFGEYQALVASASSAVCFPLGVFVTIAGVYVLSQRGGGGHASSTSVKSTPQQRNYRHYRAARPGGFATHDSTHMHAAAASVPSSSHAAATAGGSDPHWDSSSSHSSDSVSPAPAALSSAASSFHSDYSSVSSGASASMPRNVHVRQWGGADPDPDPDDECDDPLLVESTPVAPSPAPPLSFLARSFLDYPMTSASRSASSRHRQQQQAHWSRWPPAEEGREYESCGEESEEGETDAEGRVPMSGVSRSYHSTGTRAPLQASHSYDPIATRFQIDPHDIESAGSAP